MKAREIICKRWILSGNVKAITLFPFIFFNGVPSPVVRAHEYVHVEQIRRMGVTRFYLVYLWHTVRHGYNKNPLEMEAYQKQWR